MKRNANYSTKGLGKLTIVDPILSNLIVDGYKYQTTRIGNQEWICENLRAVFDFTYAFDGTNSPQYTYFNEDVSNIEYGCLYNGYAASNINQHLTDGWRVAYTSMESDILNGIMELMISFRSFI